MAALKEHTRGLKSSCTHVNCEMQREENNDRGWRMMEVRECVSETDGVETNVL